MKVGELKDLFPRFPVDTFEHVLGHVSKAAGKLHGLVGDSEHIVEINHGKKIHQRCGDAFAQAEKDNGKAASVYIADLIICAAKLADLCPSGEIDLEAAIKDRIAEKQDYLKQYDSAVPTAEARR